MSNLTASLVKELREKTGSGMMDCKKALAETNGDIDSAVDWLRAKGLSAAAKKSGRTAAEGLVSVFLKNNEAAILEVNTETDFVSRNASFQDFVQNTAELVLKSKGDLTNLLSSQVHGKSISVKEELTNLISKIGENMNVRRSSYLSIDKGFIASYIHSAVKQNLGKIGVIVSISAESESSTLSEFGKKLAMHIAATNPKFININDVDKATLDRERQVLKEQALESGKPEEVVEKMVDGRIRKFYDEIVLLEQIFVVSDEKMKVKQAISQIETETGSKIIINDFIRYTLGEGVEREEKDFASEVAEVAR